MARTVVQKKSEALDRAGHALAGVKKGTNLVGKPMVMAAGKAPAGKAPAGWRPAAIAARPTQGGKTPFASKAGAPVPAVAVKRAMSHRKKKHIEKELREQQATVDYAIPKAAFMRLVRETVAGLTTNDDGLRMQQSAIEALQAASEAMLAEFFAECNRLVLMLRQRTLSGRVARFHKQTLTRLGFTWMANGAMQAEIFDMGRGTRVQQIEGPSRIKEYMKARSALNKRKPKKAKAAAAAAAVAADAPEQPAGDEEEQQPEEEEGDAADEGEGFPEADQEDGDDGDADDEE